MALFAGPATGGPVDGRHLHSRCPKGILVADRPTRRVWIYDYTPGPLSAQLGVFVAREPDGRSEDVDRRWRAALEPDFDVVALGAIITDGGGQR
jgi:hypothetical protein